MATLQAVREALIAQPFRPFDLKLVDGLQFTITHPDFVTIVPIPHIRDIVVFTPGTDEPASYRSHRIDLALIIEVTTPTEATPPPRPPDVLNGP
jgi:hypothetical protein